MTVLVTGGAGFIGGNFILDWLKRGGETIVNLDKLTYAGETSKFKSIARDSRYRFVPGDICDNELVASLLKEHRPRALINFAAESHVDRSISGPSLFVQTNIVGTSVLLEAARHHWTTLPKPDRDAFRFVQISTDEVYGSLGPDAASFSETHPYAPNSPYAASKAAADHLVRSYHHTYGLPAITTNCSNNYGPYQFPEKLIPVIIRSAVSGKPIPLYGDGQNIRDWLHVADHCAALRMVLERGRPGHAYNVGGRSERTNLELARMVCACLDEFRNHGQARSHADLIAYVSDRPGHDRRYAIDSTKIEQEIGWSPVETFDSGIRNTVRWYLDNWQWTLSVVGDSAR
jgi:dTDP-glucose 4,6-dehydratase